MKKLSFLLAVACCATQIYAKDLKITPQINSATVYLQGASLTSSASLELPKGLHKIVLTNLPTMISEESIQVEGKGNFSIQNVSFQITNEKTEKVENLLKTKQELEEKQATQLYTKDVYAKQIALLDANKSIKGDNQNLNTVELDKIMTYYQTQMLNLNKKIHEIEITLTELKTQIAAVNQELAVYQNTQRKGEVVVSVSTSTPQTAEIYLSYYIHNASWEPLYEVRASNNAQLVQVNYKAKIFQTSGYDWNDVAITLSTGNPSLNGTVPQLEKWLLYENKPRANRVQYSMAKSAASMMYQEEAVAFDESVDTRNAAAGTVMATITNQKSTSIEFDITEKFSVQSSQNDAILTINDYKMPAEYVYKCVPKMDKHAYLLANITNFTQYNFLSGTASLYLDGKYVGNSYLNISQTTDTLSFSLGQDNGIVVERTLSDNFSKKSNIGKNYKQTIAWNISVKNTKQSAIKLVVEDNIPVSTSSSITVSNINHNDALINDKNILQWNYLLNAGETKKMNFSYTVTYPQSMSLNLR